MSTRVELDREAMASMRADESAMVSALEQCGVQVRGEKKSFRCPWHDDQSPSASYYRDGDVYRVKCFGCNVNYDVFDVLQKATGRDMSEILPKVAAERKPSATTPAVGKPTQDKGKDQPRFYQSLQAFEADMSHVTATYLYRKPGTGAIELVVFRCEPPGRRKFFRQGMPSNGGFIDRAPDAKRPLYNRDKLTTGARVVLCEGEKCCDALAQIGVLACTTPMGALSWKYADLSDLAGCLVTIWPDNDENGLKYATGVMDVLQRLDPPATVRWVHQETLGLEEGGDAADILEEMGEAPQSEKIARIMGILDGAERMNPSRVVMDYFNEVIAGRIRTVEWPWPILSRLTRALGVGSITILFGDPGGSKSFLILECLAFWMRKGVKARLLALEDNLRKHLTRALAQLTERAELMNEDWVKANAQKARELYEANSDKLDALAAAIATDREGDLTHTKAIAWLEEQGKAGARIVIIDPVSILGDGKEVASEDKEFMKAVRSIATRYQLSVILVTHPKGGLKGMYGWDSMVGGSAFPKFCHTMIVLKPHELRSSPCMTPQGERETTYNRSITIIKARDGAGMQATIAYDFMGSNLRFSERGIVVPNAKAKRLPDPAEQAAAQPPRPQTEPRPGDESRAHHAHPPRPDEDGWANRPMQEPA